jgi:hypothetical protein
MASIFFREYHNIWVSGIGGCFTADGDLSRMPLNPPAETILLYAILAELHTGQPLQIEIDLLTRRIGCDRTDIEVLQVLTQSQQLPLQIFLTSNIVNSYLL